MENLCRVFNVPFQELLDTLDTDDVSQKFDFFATDSLYKIRRASRPSCYNYDVSSKSNIAKMLNLCEDVMKPGAWPHVLLQLPVLPLNRYKPELLKADSRSSDGSLKYENGDESVFGCKKKIIVHVCDQSNVSQHPWNSSHHVDVIEQAIHFWRMVLSSDDHLESLDFYTPPTYVTGLHLATNVASGTPKVSFSETVFDLEKPN